MSGKLETLRQRKWKDGEMEVWLACRNVRRICLLLSLASHWTGVEVILPG